MNPLLLFCLILFIVPASFAQSIEGKIVDAQTNEALAGANIRLLETDQGTSANANGGFTLSPSRFPVRLEISFVGYKSTTITVKRPESNLTIRLLPSTFLNEEIIVRSVRVAEEDPFTFTSLQKEDIIEQDYSQDVPYLIQLSPSVLSTSDAGAGVGYTYLRIRGVDQARINVTINGIPLNDAESHGVFWVNTPDLASSLQRIQIQRGAGTSTNGAAAFGASINMETESLSAEPFQEVTFGLGSFNSQRATVKLGTGLLSNGWAFDGRLSTIQSDGFIDRATSDLSSYYVNAARHGDNSLLKINVFSGFEKTYQAWYGTPQAVAKGDEAGIEAYIDRNGWMLNDEDIQNLRTRGRRYNFYTYDNQVDDYQQHHYQLHYSRTMNSIWDWNVSLHYTRGSGFFETFVPDGDLQTYAIQPVTVGNTTISSSDLIRREWLQNDFYGMVFSNHFALSERSDLTFGGGLNQYDGDHFGEVIWARFAGESSIRDTYYDNNGLKTDGHAYLKGSFQLNNRLSLYGDAQLRAIRYQFQGNDRDQTNQIVPIDDEVNFLFFNPKGGLTYQRVENEKLFASVSVAQKEPTRNEFVNSLTNQRPQSELLVDYEVGFEKRFTRGEFTINGYYMDYHNQLVSTGQINDVGEYVRQNVDRSYRMGIELAGSIGISRSFSVASALTLSRNKIDAFTQFYDNYDTGIQDTERLSNTDLALSPNILGHIVFSYAHPSGFTADWIARYVSDQYLDNTQSEDRKIDAYFTNDARVRYLPSRQLLGKEVEFSLQITNIFSTLFSSNGYTFSYTSGGEFITENFVYPQAVANLMGQVRIRF